MSIKKSLGLGLIIGLLTLAFAALPAVASAAPQMTGPAGTSVPVGTTITLTSTNATTGFTGGSTLTSDTMTWHGIVKKNTGTEVEIEMDGADDTATGSKLAGASVTVTPTLELIKLTAASKTAKFSYMVAPTGLSESSTATITYTSGSETVHVEGPVGGTKAGTFKGDFKAHYLNAKGQTINIVFD